MCELRILQAIRLKGRVSEADVAATVDEDPVKVVAAMERLRAAGQILPSGATFKLGLEGRLRLAELLDEERSKVDPAAIATAYEDFRSLNAEFKALVADWQLKGGVPNNHDDPDYDDEVLSRLDAVHQRILPIVADVTAEMPRLSAYADKLSAALLRLKVGDGMWFTRPIIDSYHTVWFELHEELILAAGLTREDEADTGHAG